MASDMNQVWLIGRLTRDPELRATKTGTPVASFSLAVNRKYREVEETSFINCVAWSKAGEIISEYCKKGAKLAITGRLSQRSYDATDGTKRQVVEVVVEGFQFLSTKPKGEVTGEVAGMPDNDNPFNDEDVPF